MSIYGYKVLHRNKKASMTYLGSPEVISKNLKKKPEKKLINYGACSSKRSEKSNLHHLGKA